MVSHTEPLIRILIADDHQMMRQGLRALLAAAADMQVIAEAANGQEVLDLIRRHGEAVVLMDLDMPVMNGLDTAAALLRQYPGIRILMLTMHAEPALVRRCLQAGAAGYLLKTAGQDELLLAIRRVAAGKSYVDQDLQRQEAPASPAFARLASLTAREKEILTLIAQGKSNPEIAEMLFVSIKTVDTHRVNLMRKLDIHQVALLTQFALKAGLL
ncbi:MAG: response regulator transcription factor [Bacteroidia bacterium]|nr:response regulator transcription factor [Bacteroidia bacterium]